MRVVSVFLFCFLSALPYSARAEILNFTYVGETYVCAGDEDCNDQYGQYYYTGQIILDTEEEIMTGLFQVFSDVAYGQGTENEIISVERHTQAFEYFGPVEVIEDQATFTLVSGIAWYESCEVISGESNQCQQPLGRENAYDVSGEDVSIVFIIFGEGDWGLFDVFEDEFPGGTSEGEFCTYSGPISAAQCGVQEIPIPAAGWLLLSALMGLLIGKRR